MKRIALKKTQIYNSCRCKVKIDKVDVMKIAKYGLDKWADPRVRTSIDMRCSDILLVRETFSTEVVGIMLISHLHV